MARPVSRKNQPAPRATPRAARDLLKRVPKLRKIKPVKKG